MNILNSFTDQTIEKLNYYVYALIDPRDNKVFYYGKGVGNRVFSHEHEAFKSKEEKEEYSRKISKINDIENSGNSVIRKIINGGYKTEEEAYDAEVALINNAKIIGLELTNIVGGHHSMTGSVEEIEIEYGNHPIELQKNSGILVVNINKSYNKDLSPKELCDKVCGIWEFGNECLNVPIILFEHENIIRLAIKNIKWEYITPENATIVPCNKPNLNDGRLILDTNRNIYVHQIKNGRIKIPRYISECVYDDNELNEKYLGKKIINLQKKGNGLRPAHCKDFI